jgi:hypothetical protein
MAGMPRPFASMHDRHGRRLVLVVSDCTSAAWHSGAMGDWLARLAPRVPVAIAQPLPEETLVVAHRARLRRVQHARRHAGAPTAKLRVARPRWAEGEPGPVVPVVALEPDAVRRWARMVMAFGQRARGRGAVCRCLRRRRHLRVRDRSCAERRLRRRRRKRGRRRATPRRRRRRSSCSMAFRAAASPDALKLAVFLSAVKPLTLP